MLTKLKKPLVYALLTALLCVPLVSIAFAEPDGQSQAADAAVDNGQNLIAPAPENEETPTSEENPILIQPRDSSTNATDSSATPTEGGTEDEQNLIANYTGSDNALLVAGAVALAAVIALAASVAVLRRRKK